MVLPIGFVSDFFSPKRLATFGSLLFIIYTAGLCSFREYYQLALLALLGGFGNAIMNIVFYSLFLKVMGIGVRGKKIAFYQTGAYLGFGSGPLVGGFLVQYYTFGTLFFVSLLLSFILFALTFTLKDSEPLKLSMKDYKIEIKEKRIFLLMAVVLVYATHFGVEQTSFSLLMKQKLDFPGNRIGLVFFILGIWMAVLAPIAGHSFDKSRNVVRLLLLGLFSSSFFQIVTGYVSNFEQLMIVRVFHTMGDALIILSIGILTSEFFPEKKLGGHAGFIYVTRTLGIFVGNIGSGYTNQLFSYDTSLIINGAYIFIFTLLVTGLIKHHFMLGQHDPR
jgi:MFS family permease